jgi:hypothetical protein
MLGIKIYRRTGVFPKRPYLSQHAYINRAYELLPQDIEAVRDVKLDDVVVVGEGAEAEGAVVVIVVVEGLAQ